MLRAGHSRALDVVYDIDDDSVVYQGSIGEEANVITLVSPEEVFEDINYRQTGDDTFAKIFAAKVIDEIEETIQNAENDFDYDEDDDFDESELSDDDGEFDESELTDDEDDDDFDDLRQMGLL